MEKKLFPFWDFQEIIWKKNLNAMHKNLEIKIPLGKKGYLVYVNSTRIKYVFIFKYS